MKLCNKCKTTQPLSEFAKHSETKDRLQTTCKSCFREYRKENFERIKSNKKIHIDSIKLEGIKEYGSMCVCCGEHRLSFLTIDHVNNDGAKERKLKRRTGKKLWLHLRSLGYPKDRYRLLCFNCNSGRAANGGICPHEEERNNDTNS